MICRSGRTLTPSRGSSQRANQTNMAGKVWRPIRVDTDPSALDPIYARLPARFPELFERLLLTYRWAEVHQDAFTMFPAI